MIKKIDKRCVIKKIKDVSIILIATSKSQLGSINVIGVPIWHKRKLKYELFFTEKLKYKHKPLE